MDLKQKLQIETAEFKQQFLQITETWAHEQLKRNQARRAKYQQQGLSGYNSKNEYYREQVYAYKTPYWHFTEEFVERTVKNSDEHFEDSLSKLVYKIKEKQLDVDKIEVISLSINYSLDITLSDGKQKVHAWTIVASGPIKRPHFRFLVK